MILKLSAERSAFPAVHWPKETGQEGGTIRNITMMSFAKECKEDFQMRYVLVDTLFELPCGLYHRFFQLLNVWTVFPHLNKMQTAGIKEIPYLNKL